MLEAAHSKRVLDGLPDRARSLDGAIDCCEHAAAGHGGDGQAIATARQAKGDWHQLYARTQLCQGQADVPQQCSGKDASLADAPPCFVATQLLKGTAPESCPLDHSVVVWTERNLGLHYESVEDMAAPQETMAAPTCLYAGDATGAELFRLAATMNTTRVQYQTGLYVNPYQKAEINVSAIRESFFGSRDTHARLLKKRHLEDASRDEQSQEEATKPKAKARRAAKSRATPKRATRVAPPNMASVPS